jgi:hypothetical protein
MKLFAALLKWIFTLREPRKLSLLKPVTVPVSIRRTICHKGKIAPEGCVFYILSCTINGRWYSMRETVKITPFNPKQEFFLRLKLIEIFKSHFKIS